MLRKYVIAVFMLFACCLPAFAGQNCTEEPVSAGQLRKALTLGVKVRDALEASGARVALIGRIGADLSEYGLRYSHMAFVERDALSGHWVVVHLLNHCGTADSALFEEGLGAFFLDSPKRYEAVLLVPGARAQENIVRVLDQRGADALFDRHYNMIANARATRFQNSNQWVLEALALALAPEGEVMTREDAQRYAFAAGYRPGVLRIGPGKRLGARLFAGNVSFSDHPMQALNDSRFEVVTVESVLSFMQRVDPGRVQKVLSLGAESANAR